MPLPGWECEHKIESRNINKTGLGFNIAWAVASLLFSSARACVTSTSLHLHLQATTCEANSRLSLQSTTPSSGLIATLLLSPHCDLCSFHSSQLVEIHKASYHSYPARLPDCHQRQQVNRPRPFSSHAVFILVAGPSLCFFHTTTFSLYYPWSVSAHCPALLKIKISYLAF